MGTTRAHGNRNAPPPPSSATGSVVPPDQPDQPDPPFRHWHSKSGIHRDGIRPQA